MQRRLVTRDARDQLRCFHERVVGLVGHRAVAGRPLHAKARPLRALLRGHDRQLRARPDRHAHAAELGHEVVALHVVPGVFGEPLGTPRAQRLLIRDRRIDERALRPEAAVKKALQRDGHRRGDVEHVDGAAPPYLAVDELAGERIVLPARTRDGHDIGVAHEVKARRVLVGPLDAHDEAASPRRRLVPLHLDARCREIGRKEVRAPYLVTGGWRAVVHALIADELLEEIGGLREDRRHDEGDSSRAPRRVRVGADSASSPRSARAHRDMASHELLRPQPRARAGRQRQTVRR